MIFLLGPLVLGGTGWGTDEAAHLLRRAGFGGTPKEIESLAALGREGAVEALLDFEKAPFEFPPPSITRRIAPRPGEIARLSPEDKKAVKGFERANRRVLAENLSGWFLRRMAATPRPLEEKLVLFWHGHFTSGLREVEDPFKLYRQNELFRRHALDFRALVHEVSRDPAMIRYLDTDRNSKAKPNENFARELMELFTMGEGNYTEQDIKEAARAFTGWAVDRESGEFRERPRLHDAGVKRFLGAEGNFEGGDIIEIILKQPATAEFLSRKLWRFFAATEPSEETLQGLAKAMRASDYRLRPVLKALFTSREFYAPEVRFENIKSPVELVVGALRTLEVRPADSLAFTQALQQMGQQLFQPPNVKGWEGGAKWIDAASFYTRASLGLPLLYGTEAPRSGADPRERLKGRIEDVIEELDLEMAARDPNPPQPAWDPLPAIETFGLDTPEKLVDHFLARLLQRPVGAEARALLVRHFQEVGGDLSKAESAKTRDAVRGVVHLILSMPEFQVS